MSGGARLVAGGTDLVVGARQGKAPLPDSLVAIHAIESLRGITGSGGGLRLGALATHEEIVAPPGRSASGSRALAGRVGDRRLARDARPGDDRRQRDERLAGHGDGRPARLLRRDGHAPVRRRLA